MTKLPVHGFVLAGGKSSRMGQDKALIHFRGQPMIEIALGKLRKFCAEVSISGDREDLGRYASIVTETRLCAGPAAGIEAALQATMQPWILCVPVDVPLVPTELLSTWAAAVIAKPACAASYLQIDQQQHPSFCMLRRDCFASVHLALDGGERQLSTILESVQGPSSVLWRCDVSEILPVELSGPMERLFCNINTKKELEAAEILSSQ